MFDKLSHKQKFLALLGVCLLLLIAGYIRSYSGAIQSVSAYKSAKKQLVNSEQLNAELAELTAINAKLDAQIGNQQMDAVLVQNAVVEFIAEQKGKTQLTEVTPMHSYSDAYFSRYSNKITLSGSFNDLLATIYAFEREFSASRISHVSMYTKKNFKTRKNELFTDLLFQHYERH